MTASVYDPFGNVLGVMFNQHYLRRRERHHVRDIVLQRRAPSMWGVGIGLTPSA